MTITWTRVGILALATGGSLGLAASAMGAVVAFPGAEGHGAATPGGRGGRVIEVTTLADSGPGSLRAAVGATGPRIVVFRVGGTIDLASRVNISNPFLTIAGQTAPGDGIQLKGAGLQVRASDVILRGLRIRPGDAAQGPSPIIRDAFETYGQRVIVDHCSFSWGIDENASTWYADVEDITFQWNIISEGLMNAGHDKGPHSMGLLIGDGAQRVSVHKNLFAHNNERYPLIKGGTNSEVVNNMMYNWGNYATYFYWDAESLSDAAMTGLKPTLANIVGNFYKPGTNASATRKPIAMNTGVAVAGSKIHLVGNVGPGRMQDSGDEWGISNIPAQFRSATPAATTSGIAVTSADVARERVLRCAGARAPRRDSVDERVVKSVLDGTGRIIDSPSQVGGWPNLASGQAPADGDKDGMPDAWESARGLNPSDASDGPKVAASGYTNVEEYINGLIPSCDGDGPAPAVDAGATPPTVDAGSGARADAGAANTDGRSASADGGVASADAGVTNADGSAPRDTGVRGETDSGDPSPVPPSTVDAGTGGVRADARATNGGGSGARSDAAAGGERRGSSNGGCAVGGDAAAAPLFPLLASLGMTLLARARGWRRRNRR